MCEDYRAGASIDLEHDRGDLDRRIACPLLVLWGAENPIWERFDMLDVWRQRAQTVNGRRSRAVITCGRKPPTRRTLGYTSSSLNKPKFMDGNCELRFAGFYAVRYWLMCRYNTDGS
jgi:hypothetical protein